MTFDYPPTLLPERASMIVDGPDARGFLGNLLTADVSALKGGEACYGALLTPQGKILHDMFVHCVLDEESGKDVFLIDCARSQIESLLKRFTMYKLRAEVRITPNVNSIFAASSGDAVIWDLKYMDPRMKALGWRGLMKSPEGFGERAGYHRARIAAGLADTDADLGSGEFFPHEANFDQFGAVSFTKGCYVGQEVVSRMEHRGLARSRILPIRCDGPSPPRGSDIRSGEKSVGTVLGSEGDMALALIRLDRLAEGAEPLLSGAVRVEVLKPAFARYDVPQSKG